MGQENSESKRSILDIIEEGIAMKEKLYSLKINSLMQSMIMIRFKFKLLKAGKNKDKNLLDINGLEKSIRNYGEDLREFLDKKEDALPFFYEAGQHVQDELGVFEEGNIFDSHADLVSEALRIVYDAPTIKNITKDN